MASDNLPDASQRLYSYRNQITGGSAPRSWANYANVLDRGQLQDEGAAHRWAKREGDWRRGR